MKGKKLGGPPRRTLSEFIEKAQAKHGARYDYSRTVYEHSAKEVQITCPVHGVFLQVPTNHLQGYGCSKCGGRSRLTTADFIEKALAIHGHYYDYSQVAYQGVSKKVEIGCPVHGKFWQVAISHTTGSGCPDCGDERSASASRSNTEEFISAARAAHGDKYDYSRTAYNSSKQKVKIICPMHGEFLQNAGDHTQGVGCPACSGRALLDTIRFIDKSRAAHGDKYDYSRVSCLTGRDKVEIICATHGAFTQVASHHASGYGCPKCRYIKSGHAIRSSTGEFLAAARARHGDKYDYSRVDYTRSKQKVKIICPMHGEFLQNAGDHTQGAGCNACAQEVRAAGMQLNWVERASGRSATLYLVRLFNDKESFYKVGITFNSIEKRFCRSNLPDYQYEVLALHKSNSPARVYDWEQSILETFTHLCYKPIAHFVGATECFSSADEILSIFPL